LFSKELVVDFTFSDDNQDYEDISTNNPDDQVTRQNSSTTATFDQGVVMENSYVPYDILPQDIGIILFPDAMSNLPAIEFNGIVLDQLWA
jgi:hypothetical protein